MYWFGVLLFFGCVIWPPIEAVKGKGRRGLWLAHAFASLLLALLFFAASANSVGTKAEKDVVPIASGIVWILFGCFLGGIFAAMLYKPATTIN